MTRTLELNCLVVDDRKPNIDRIIPVELSDECTVATLKEKINEQKPSGLQGIRTFPAEALELWTVSILATEEFSETHLRDIQKPAHPPLLPEARLSEIFPNTPLDEHLHIVVQPPASAGLLQLNCLVLGDRRDQIFTVEIAGTRSVSWLRDAIKGKGSRFNHTDASDLVVWKVSEIIDENLENDLEKVNFIEEESLCPIDTLWEVFPSLPIQGHLHIVVELPEDESPESLQGRRMKLCRAKKDRAPSTQAHFTTFRYEQEKAGHEIYCGRPIGLDRAVPASLYDETLSQFHHDLTHCKPTVPDISCFSKLRWALTEIFEDKMDRHRALVNILREGGVIPRGGNLARDTISRHTPTDDRYGTTPCCYGDFLYFVQKTTNEISTGYSEPYLEAIHYWWAHVRQHIERKTSKVRGRLNFPAILLIQTGSHLSVAVAILTDVLNIEPLTTIALHVHSTHISGVYDVGSRFICALRTALQSLHNFYKAADNLPRRQIEYPFRDYILQNGTKKPFKYMEQINDKRVFRCTLKGGGTPFFIEFSRRYGEESHRAAHEAGLAPNLLSVEEIHEWYIVATEDLSQDYESLYDVYNTDQARYFSLLPDVKAAVQKLHALGYVHGDIRPINILVRKLGVESGSLVVFISWGWGGAIGKVCYPDDMNSAIKWPEGAMIAEEIKPEHDLDMVSFCSDPTVHNIM